MENSLETKKNAIGLMHWQQNPTPSPLSNFLELSPIAREVEEEGGRKGGAIERTSWHNWLYMYRVLNTYWSIFIISCLDLQATIPCNFILHTGFWKDNTTKKVSKIIFKKDLTGHYMVL